MDTPTIMAEKIKTLCHPHKSVSPPLMSRDPNIPQRMPLNTFPTFLPRLSLPKVAAMGSIIWAGVEHMPSMKLSGNSIANWLLN